MRHWVAAIGFVIFASTAALAQQGQSLGSLQERLAAIETPEQALALAGEADALAQTLERGGESEPAARALRIAGVSLMGAERHGEAVTRFQRSADLCRAAGDEGCLGRALNNAGVALQAGERMGEALRSLRLASEAFARAGEAELAATTRFNAANIQLALGDPAGALAVYRELERDWADGNFALGLLTNTGQALLELSRFSEADVAAQRALTLAENPAAREGYLADMRIVNVIARARAAAGQGDRARALAHLADAERRSSGQDRDAYTIALGCLQVHAALRSLREATACGATIDRLRNLEDEGTRTEALALAAQSFAASGDLARAFALQSAAFDALGSDRRAALAEASAMATAEVGLSERTALVEQIRREQAEERAASERFRLLAAMLVGGLIVGGGLGVFGLLRQQAARRKANLAEERARVARDLHDTALQGFAGVAMQLDGVARQAVTDAPSLADRLVGLARDARASLAQVRDAVWQMRSPQTDAGDLGAAIAAWLAERREQTPPISATIDLGSLKLAPAHLEALLRVVQEAVANAAHHGQAKTVSIRATLANGSIDLEIADDGVGFSPTDAAAMGGRWGLLGMRERVEGLGGSLVIESAPGAGTRIKTRTPV